MGKCWTKFQMDWRIESENTVTWRVRKSQPCTEPGRAFPTVGPASGEALRQEGMTSSGGEDASKYGEPGPRGGRRGRERGQDQPSQATKFIQEAGWYLNSDGQPRKGNSMMQMGSIEVTPASVESVDWCRPRADTGTLVRRLQVSQERRRGLVQDGGSENDRKVTMM